MLYEQDMNEEAYRDGSSTDLWIGSDCLTSGTSDEKRECMGYDNMPESSCASLLTNSFT
jgi:hypothetical protein